MDGKVMKSRIPSPARSLGAPRTPRRNRSRLSRSVGSPRRTPRLSALARLQDEDLGSFHLSPVLTQRSVLTDNTDIEEPRRKSWWKKLDDNNSREIMDVLENEQLQDVHNVMEEYADVEVLSQEKRNYSLDMPESSGSESIDSIVVPQRKLFTQKENQPVNRFGKLKVTRESLAKLQKTNIEDKTVHVPSKKLFGQGPSRSSKAYPALVGSPDKTGHHDSIVLEQRNIEDKTANVLSKKLFGMRPSRSSKAYPALVQSPDKIQHENSIEQRDRKKSLKSKPSTSPEKISLSVEPKNLLQSQAKRTKPLFPAELLNMSPNKTKELNVQPKAQARSLFGNRPDNKRKNRFADFIVSESEEEIPDIQPKPVTRRSSATKRLKDSSPTSSMTTDIELEDWKMLPSSTMMVDQLENMIANTPKKMRLSKVAEVNKSIASNKSKSPSTKSPSQNAETTIMHNKYHVENNEAHEILRYEDDHIIEQEDADSQAHGMFQKVIENIKSLHEDNNESNTKLSNQIEKHDKQGKNVSSENVINKSILKDASDEKCVEIEDSEQIDQDNNEDNQVNDLEDEAEVNESENDSVLRDPEESIAQEEEDDENQEIVELQQAETDELPEVVEKDQADDIANSTTNNVRHSKQEQKSTSSIDINISAKQTNNNDKKNNESQEVKQSESIKRPEEEEETEESNNSETENINNSEAKQVDETMESNQNESIDQANETDEEENEEESSEHAVESDQEENEEVDASQEQEADNSAEVDAHESEDEQEPEITSAVEDNEDDQAVEDNEDDQAVETDQEENEEVEESFEQAEESDQEENEEADESTEQEAANSTEEDAHESDDEHLPDTSDALEDNKQEEEEVDDEHMDQMSDEEIEGTPNTSYNATGNRKRDTSHVKSPEAALHAVTRNDTPEGGRRNTSIRRTVLLRSSEPRLSIPSLRESGGESSQGSGWDSHRTTKKTLRQTFGKDFSPRKSLRALVMEKSANRQTLPNALAKPTEDDLGAEASVCSVGDVADDGDQSPNVSRRTRQATLEMFLQEVKKNTIQRKRQMENEILSSLRAPAKESFKLPLRPAPRRLRAAGGGARAAGGGALAGRTGGTGALAGRKGGAVPLPAPPPTLAQDLAYKPPKRFTNASWITKRLYKFLEAKLEPTYDYKARVRAERLVMSLCDFASVARRAPVAADVAALREEMARVGVVRTHADFYDFFHEFMPREVRIKVVPDIHNKLPLPRAGVCSNILKDAVDHR